MKRTRQSKSPTKNIEEIRRKNLKDNQLFLQKLRIDDVNILLLNLNGSCHFLLKDSERFCQIYSKGRSKKERNYST